MRGRAELGDLAHLQADVGVDEIIGEHAARGEELAIAVERFHSIGEQLNPSQPEEFPGLPPRSQMMSEVMAAMMPPSA